MSAASTPSRIHIAQWRIKGATEGLRVLRQIQGEQRWHLHWWVIHADGARDDHTIRNDKPCAMRLLQQQAMQCIEEVTNNTPTVINAGWDAYVVKA